MHSRFFINLVNLVGWASPTKHLVYVAYYLVGDAHPTLYGKAALPYNFIRYTQLCRSFIYFTKD
ncbi:MAG: hypothetical protein HUU08_10190 [Candidatus Brocadia sp.]|nr:hypothetical protein [Candidatus Brocadia sp.]